MDFGAIGFTNRLKAVHQFILGPLGMLGHSWTPTASLWAEAELDQGHGPGAGSAPGQGRGPETGSWMGGMPAVGLEWELSCVKNPVRSFTHGTRQEVALKIYFRMYAYIVYQIDGIRKIVPISDIKDYNPRDTRDFNPSVTVRALWRGIRDNIAVEDALRYNARVLRLGDTREDIEASRALRSLKTQPP